MMKRIQHLIMAKNQSNEAFNAGKEIEAMKHLTLHRIASSHRFIASLRRIASSLYRFMAFYSRSVSLEKLNTYF